MRVDFFRLLIVVFIFLSFSGCEQNPKNNENTTPTTANHEKIKDQFVKANQMQLQKESDEMDAYERSHQMTFVKTKSGIRYHVYKTSEKGDSIRKGMAVNLNYRVFLLDGTLCYSSNEDGTRNFVVEQEQIESGIHVGLQYLKNGDKAFILIPSHLAHGLLGDFKKIPPQMPIVYDVEVF